MRRGKRRAGERAPQKDVKNEGRSGNVYENKGLDDNFPDRKDDICAWLNAILHRKARILQKTSALLPLFERWETNLPLQNESPFETWPGRRVQYSTDSSSLDMVRF